MDTLLLLDATRGRPGLPSVVDELLPGLRRKGPRIRCPRCRWQPRRRDRWYCSRPGCGTTWNTFETRGRCPGCSHQWLDTCCLACHRWSRHADWYAADDGPGAAT